MKKLLLLASMLILTGVGKSMAGQVDLFSYDAIIVENQMAQLNQLEGYVLDNPGVTLGQMATDGNTLASLVSDLNGINGFNGMNEKVLGIPGFLWGCVGGWVGILVVYLNGNDPHEMKQATIGCATEAVVVAGCYVTIWVIYGVSFWSLFSTSSYY